MSGVLLFLCIAAMALAIVSGVGLFLSCTPVGEPLPRLRQRRIHSWQDVTEPRGATLTGRGMEEFIRHFTGTELAPWQLKALQAYQSGHPAFLDRHLAAQRRVR